MPSLISKRGKLRWMGNVQVDHVKKTRVFPDDSRKSRNAAVIWEDQTRKELEAATDSDYWTVLDWATKYLEFAHEQFVKKVFDEKRFALSRLLNFLGPDDPVDSITREMALAHLLEQKKTRLLKRKKIDGKIKLVPKPYPRGGAAANRDRKNLSAAWTYGREFLDGFPRGNPFHDCPKFPEDSKPRYVPPESDFWKVYNEAGAQDKVMLICFLHLAARRGEIFRMTWDDVDFINGQVRLWTRKRENGALEHDLIPMTSTLRSTLRQWWQDRPVKDSSHVFVCLDPLPCNEFRYGQPFNNRQHIMRRWSKRAKVKPFGFHAIRHLTASILYHAGEDLAVIQAILRHKSPTTTSRYLQRLGLQGAKDGLERSLKGPAEVIELSQKKKPRKRQLSGQSVSGSVSGL